MSVQWGKYKKKPIVIMARQHRKPFSCEGMTGKAGDYEVIGVRGERYPVDRDTFEYTHDKVPGKVTLKPEGS